MSDSRSGRSDPRRAQRGPGRDVRSASAGRAGSGRLAGARERGGAAARGPVRARTPQTGASERALRVEQAGSQGQQIAPSASRGAGSRTGSGADGGHRSRLTARAGILILVVALLVVSYASSMRAYLQQRSQITQLQSQISHQQAAIDELGSQRGRWRDPAYAEERARQIGYTMPGETPYVVVSGGKPLSAGGTLDTPAILDKAPPPAWWSQTWDSMEVAGDPPTKAAPVPVDTVPAPAASSSSSSSTGH